MSSHSDQTRLTTNNFAAHNGEPTDKGARDKGSDCTIAQCGDSRPRPIITELEACIANYKPTAEYNDSLWKSFAQKTVIVSCLRVHRDWVEENAWGFGDRAFHYMWYMM